MFEILDYIKTFFLIDNKGTVAQWKAIFEQMAVHTRKKLPETLLLKQRPNETTEILNYRLSNYRAITYGSMNRAMDSTSRILNKVNYTVNANEATKEYLKTKNFSGTYLSATLGNYDFYTYLEKIVFKRDIEDPNGFIVWLPFGDGITDSSKKVQPKPILFFSFQLYDANAHVISFLSSEKSIVIKGDKEEISGDVYYLITRNEFYKLVQYGRGDEKKFRLDLIYNHNIGEIPVIVLGGDMNADGMFESFFAPYVAFGDEAISTFSDWQAIKVTSGFPYREEFYTECEIKHVNKSSNNPSASEQKFDARIEMVPMNKSPYGSIIRKIPGNPNDNTLLGDRVLAAEIPSIRFIGAPVEVARYSGESWEKLIEMAEDSLHLNLANGTNQSGIAKEKDLEQERAMINKIACNFFDNIMLNSIKYVEAYLLNVPIEKVNVSISKPANFVLKSEDAMIEEIALLKEKNVPALFLSEATNELAKRRFSGNPISQKIFEAIAIIDPLYIYDVNQKGSLVNSGVITKDAYIKSVYIYSLLLKISKEKTMDVFLRMTIDEIKELFEEEVEQYLSEEPATLFNSDGTNG